MMLSLVHILRMLELFAPWVSHVFSVKDLSLRCCATLNKLDDATSTQWVEQYLVRLISMTSVKTIT